MSIFSDQKKDNLKIEFFDQILKFKWNLKRSLLLLKKLSSKIKSRTLINSLRHRSENLLNLFVLYNITV